MKIACNMRALCSGLLVAAGICFPATLFGQAAPGPIAPPDTVFTDRSAAPPPKTRVSQGKPTIVGSWKLNRDESDDPRRKLLDAQQSQSGGSGGRSGGVHVGGYPGGGYPGGGYPGGAGGGGHGGHRDQQSTYNNDDLNRLSDVMSLPRTLTVLKTDSVVELTDDLDRKREFFTDGRKVEKSRNSKDDSYREASAKWEESRLVSQEDGPKGGKIERILSPIEGDGGPQLNETFKIIDSHGTTTAVIRLVFDRVEPPAEASKQ